MNEILELINKGAHSPILAALISAALTKYSMDGIKCIAGLFKVVLPSIAIQVLTLPCALGLFSVYMAIAREPIGENLGYVLLASLGAIGYHGVVNKDGTPTDTPR